MCGAIFVNFKSDKNQWLTESQGLYRMTFLVKDTMSL